MGTDTLKARFERSFLLFSKLSNILTPLDI